MTGVVYTDDQVTIHHGDCLALLPQLDDESVDAVITDPPYGLNFMGASWDSAWRSQRDRHHKHTNRHATNDMGAYQQWCYRWAVEILRVVKPGAHVAVFGSPRTSHRLTCALEDAGFQIRDSIAWLHGQGFPKNLDVGRVLHRSSPEPQGASHTPVEPWEGWGTALKPAFEPIVLARRPLDGTVVDTVRTHGTGAINIDGTRVHADDSPPRTRHPTHSERETPTRSHESHLTPGHSNHTTTGRWPPNVVLTHDATCRPDLCAPICPIAILDTQSGVRPSGANPHRRHAPVFSHVYGHFLGQPTCTPARGPTTGTASRFFPQFRWHSKAPQVERPTVNGVRHPTVKPVGLITWLVTLLTPPAGLVLDPFLGSGTTAQAAQATGMRLIGFETNEKYIDLIKARLSRSPTTQPDHRQHAPLPRQSRTRETDQ